MISVRTLQVVTRECPYLPMEVIVVDNASSDDTVSRVREHFPDVVLLAMTTNTGTAGRNEFIRAARGKYIFCLDDDSLPGNAQYFHAITDWMEKHPDVSLLSTRCVQPRGRLVEVERVARDIGCSQGSRSLGSAFIVSATGTTPAALDRIDAIVREELTALGGDKPPTQAELQGAFTAYEVGFYGTLETITGKAGAMSAYLERLGRPDGFAVDLERYERATPDSVRAAVAKTFAKPAVRLDIVPEVTP